MKNILVPCDFSAPAQEAFRFAVSIASQSKGEIDVLHVIDLTFLKGHSTLAYNYAFNATFLTELEAEANKNFQAMRRRFAPLTLPVRYHHQIGTLLVDVERYIREREIDLVIMGTRGQGGAEFGSNTEKVVRNVSAPVLVLHECPGKPIRDIIFPALIEESDGQLSTDIKTLQEFFHARVHLIWINTPFTFKPDSESRLQLEGYAQHLGITDYSTSVRADYTVEEGILRFAKEIPGALIAMGTHARKGLSHWSVGSITEKVISQTRLPVWTRTLHPAVQHELPVPVTSQATVHTTTESGASPFHAT